MTIQTTKPKHGFSLVELLLTLVLILCLAAASVFTFTTLYRSANLDEGYDRFQSLIRFAQAEAATTGRKVRLQFVAARSVSNVAADEKDLRNIEVTWEADALNAPGVFQSYTNKSWSEEMVNELIGVEKVQPIQSPNVPNSVDSAQSLVPADVSAESIPGTPGFPAVTFYPDGSCDSAEIILASRNPEDERRVEVRLSGMLGSVSSRTLSAEQLESSFASESLEGEVDYDGLFEDSQPSTSASTESLDAPAF